MNKRIEVSFASFNIFWEIVNLLNGDLPYIAIPYSFDIDPGIGFEFIDLDGRGIIIIKKGICIPEKDLLIDDHLISL